MPPTAVDILESQPGKVDLAVALDKEPENGHLTPDDGLNENGPLLASQSTICENGKKEPIASQLSRPKSDPWRGGASPPSGSR